MFGRLSSLPRRQTSTPRQSAVRLVCPHLGNAFHRLAKLTGQIPADGGLRPAGIDRNGGRHFRCVCGYHTVA